MASIKEFKKDINYVTSELVIECFTYNYLFPEKNHEPLAKVISESLAMRNELIKQVNQVKPTNENPAKKQFKSIRESFVKKTEDLVKQLEKLS